MNILIVSHYFPPFNVVAAQRPYSWARHWANAGHCVTVLTSLQPPRPDDIAPDISGIEVLQVPIPFFENILSRIDGRRISSAASRPEDTAFLRPGKVRCVINWFQRRYGIFLTSRMPDICDLWVRPALNAIRGRKFDVVISTYGPYACHWVASRVRRHGGIWVADFRDLWTEGHIFPGLFPFTLIERCLEKQWLRRADLVTTVSEPLAAILRSKGAQRVEVVENGFDRQSLANLPPARYWQNDGRRRLVYTGTVYRGKQDASPLFAAIRQLQDEGLEGLEKLEVVFATKQSQLIMESAKFFGVEQFLRLPGYVCREDALRMQRDADALILLEFHNDRRSQGILTGKIFEYISSGTQVWGIGTQSFDATGMLINAAGVGQCFGADVGSIARAIADLLHLSTGGQVVADPEILKRYDRANLADKMMNLIEECRTGA